MAKGKKPFFLMKKSKPKKGYAKGGMVTCAKGGAVRGYGAATKGCTPLKVY